MKRFYLLLVCSVLHTQIINAVPIETLNSTKGTTESLCAINSNSKKQTDDKEDSRIFYKRIILDEDYLANTKNHGGALFNYVGSTIYVIRVQYDLKGQTIHLGRNSILYFEGGSFTNGILYMQESNTVVSVGNIQCFYNILFKGIYRKVFCLSWIGIVADGTDKYNILSRLVELVPYRKLSVEGVIICGGNGINIPEGTSIYGTGAELLFTSKVGEYCLSLSYGAEIHDLKLSNSNYDYNGSILLISNAITDEKAIAEGSRIYGSACITIDNLIIDPAYHSINGIEDIAGYQATGIKIVATNEEKQWQRCYFTKIHMHNINVTKCNKGIDILVENFDSENEETAWGNEINIDLLYSKSKYGFIYRCIDHTGQMSGAGACNISNYCYQGYRDGIGFVADGKFEVPLCINNFRSWDNYTMGEVRNGAEVIIDNDYFLIQQLDSELLSGYKRVYGKGKQYKIQQGKLLRKNVVYSN